MTESRPLTVAEIARQLLSRRDRTKYPEEDFDVAFLVHRLKRTETRESVNVAAQGHSKLYFAFHRKSDSAPTSAVVRLIQGIYATEAELSRILVRNRIYTTGKLTTMCRGMIAVAAKRATDQILETSPDISHHASSHEKGRGSTGTRSINDGISLPDNQIDLTNSVNALSGPLDYGASVPQFRENPHTFFQDKEIREQTWMKLAIQLTAPLHAERENQGRLFQYNRPVAAVLVSRSGELLEWALNTNAVNKTLHAELNLVQSYYRKHQAKLPAGAKLYATLKPCKMCAAMVADAAEDMRTLEVVYAEDDPGPNARNTALEKIQRKLEILD